MGIEEFVEKIGLPGNGNWDGDVYTLTLDDSDKYAAVYTKLDKSDMVALDVSSMILSDDKISLTYIGDDYDVIVSGSLNDNEYTVTVKAGE